MNILQEKVSTSWIHIIIVNKIQHILIFALGPVVKEKKYSFIKKLRCWFSNKYFEILKHMFKDVTYRFMVKDT